MRPRQRVLIGAAVFLVCCTIYLFQSSSASLSYGGPSDPNPPSERPPVPEPGITRTIPAGKPKPAPDDTHPIRYLMTNSERNLQRLQARQSRTLEDAVAEYRRRYKMPPPPHFDKWFAFAKSNDVVLIDEFDTIFELITPFWGLKPSTIRSRAAEVIGFFDWQNQCMGVQIRDGNATNISGANEWQQEATHGMMKKFVQWLPDMDLAFNIHDEPRVMVPHEDMARLVQKAKEVTMPAANEATTLSNAFTRPDDLVDGWTQTKLTRFNVFAHQPTWTHSRMSCPPDSPSRALEDDERVDDVSKYGLGELGFIYNETAMSDICLTPSLSESFGFFDRPNAFNIVHDLFPIFSQSKISSYSDMIYPSPWYWYEKVAYNEKKDMSWNRKKDRLYWRGSTTGGFSRNGGWRRQHRQRFVSKVNELGTAKILVNQGDEDTQNWQVEEVSRGEYKSIMDVYFSHVGQCDDGDCNAQRQFFDVKGHAEQQDAWKYKYLLDIDGNAFSGRFYAFLQSRSLVYKLAVFREWHFEWLKSWVHYIPLSLQGEEWLEAVRFFADSEDGKKEAERLAMEGREWANRVLRKVDMEAWFFRLLLEYGRVIDDNRENIGFTL
ncbi:hypothetical protein GQ53DRAFT_71963 [Thozetella sp. PMI_491]|nr:hypothetical protein GQ53DRAFT_71963 [Thozetella sp. PMI_491]